MIPEPRKKLREQPRASKEQKPKGPERARPLDGSP